MSYGNAVLADSPSFYWRMNETSGVFADIAGNGHDATYVAGTRGSTALNADTGSASVLLATASKIASVPNSGAVPQTGPFTVECLVKFTSVPSGSNFHWICTGPSGGWGCGLQDANNWLYTLFGVADNVGGGTLGLTTGTVYHLAWVVTTTPNVQAYKNGVANGTPVALGTEVNSTNGIAIGATIGNADALPGNLSDVAIYPAALSSTQLTNHFNAISSGGSVGGGGGGSDLNVYRIN